MKAPTLIFLLLRITGFNPVYKMCSYKLKFGPHDIPDLIFCQRAIRGHGRRRLTVELCGWHCGDHCRCNSQTLVLGSYLKKGISAHREKTLVPNKAQQTWHWALTSSLLLFSAINIKVSPRLWSNWPLFHAVASSFHPTPLVNRPFVFRMCCYFSPYFKSRFFCWQEL
jgi:hypothetical protein